MNAARLAKRSKQVPVIEDIPEMSNEVPTSFTPDSLCCDLFESEDYADKADRFQAERLSKIQKCQLCPTDIETISNHLLTSLPVNLTRWSVSLWKICNFTCERDTVIGERVLNAKDDTATSTQGLSDDEEVDSSPREASGAACQEKEDGSVLLQGNAKKHARQKQGEFRSPQFIILSVILGCLLYGEMMKGTDEHSLLQGCTACESHQCTNSPSECICWQNMSSIL